VWKSKKMNDSDKLEKIRKKIGYREDTGLVSGKIGDEDCCQNCKSLRYGISFDMCGLKQVDDALYESPQRPPVSTLVLMVEDYGVCDNFCAQ